MSVHERILEMIAERFEVSVDTLSEDTEFVADLNADSLDQVELTMDMEDEFSLPEVPEDALMKIVTIGDLIEYVENNIES